MPANSTRPEDARGADDIRARLRKGELIVGLMVVEFFTPALPRILADAGIDFAVFDMESSGLNHERLEALAALSRAAGVAPFVRVPGVSAAEIGRVLDLGAAGVMAPKIEDVVAAEALARAVRYPPEGARGSGYGAADGYLRPATAADRAVANDAVLVICQLESSAAVADADRIAAVPGIDVVIVGANDLAAELGVDTADPGIREAADRVRASCVRNGVAFGGRLAGDGPIPDGHRLVLVEHDTAALSVHLRARVATLQKADV